MGRWPRRRAQPDPRSGVTWARFRCGAVGPLTGALGCRPRDQRRRDHDDGEYTDHDSRRDVDPTDPSRRHPHSHRTDRRRENEPPGGGPEEHAEDDQNSATGHAVRHAEAGEQGAEREDRHRIREREAEDREVGTGVSATTGRDGCRLGRPRLDGLPREPEQERATDQSEHLAGVDEDVGHRREAERRDRPVRRIRRRDAQTRDETVQAAFGEGSPDDEEADRPDRGGDRETEDETAKRKCGVHGIGLREEADDIVRRPRRVPGRRSAAGRRLKAREVSSRRPASGVAARIGRRPSL